MIAALIVGRPVHVHGDGSTSRDFCYVANTVQANLLAACSEDQKALNEVYNVAVEDRTTLNELFALPAVADAPRPDFAAGEPIHGAFRAGDVQHSQADIAKAVRLLGYPPRPSNRRRAGRGHAQVRAGGPAAIERNVNSLSPAYGVPLRSAAAVAISGQVSAAPVPSIACMPTSAPTLASNSKSARSSPRR